MTKKRKARNDVVDQHLRRALFGMAGGRCMKPDCRDRLAYSEPGTGRVRTTGEVAHIYGVKPNAERYVEDMAPEERDRPEHLLVLCPTCHDMIDKPGAHVAFPAEKLLRWHQQREQELDRTAGRAPVSFGFQELQRVVRLLPAAPRGTSPPTEPPEIQDKLDWNNLSDRVHALVAIGLERAGSVTKYLQSQEKLHPGQASVIEGAIAKIYREHRARTDGDALFYALRNEISYGLHVPAELSAADAVLSYFFTTCDVFERPR